MIPWWQGRMCAVDLETTSVEEDDARIVTAAVAFVGGGEPTEAFSWLADPLVEIPEGATAVHGITTEKARAEGQPTAFVQEAVLACIERAEREGLPVIAHNMRYDFTVLDREARRRGQLAGVLGRVLGVDPIVIERFLDRYRPKRIASHSLEDCCKVWNVKLEGAHDATYDAIAAVRLAYRLAKDGRVIRRTRDAAERAEFIAESQEWERVRHDLPALFEWQQRIAWDEAVRLEAYFRAGDERKGVPPQPDRHVPREWPIIPVGGGVRGVVQVSAAELLTPEWTT